MVQIVKGKTSVGATAIQFLSTQTLVFATSTSSSTGTLCTVTPAAGKTFILIGAHCVVTAGPFNLATESYAAELRNEANVRDSFGAVGSCGGGSSSSVNMGDSYSIVKGDRLIGDGAKTYTIEVIGSTGQTVRGSIFGYEIDT